MGSKKKKRKSVYSKVTLFLSYFFWHKGLIVLRGMNDCIKGNRVSINVGSSSFPCSISSSQSCYNLILVYGYTTENQIKRSYFRYKFRNKNKRLHPVTYPLEFHNKDTNKFSISKRDKDEHSRQLS